DLPEVQTRPLEHAGIVDFFERRFSGTASNITSRRGRPMPRLKGASQSGPRSSVSSLAWRGRCGLDAALIKRVGNDLLGVGPQPRIVGGDLDDVASRSIARYKE